MSVRTPSFVNLPLKLAGGQSGIEAFVTNDKLEYPGHTFSLGVPKVVKIFFSWSYSDLPVNSGSIKRNSANMHPTDQISIGVEYSWKINLITNGYQQNCFCFCLSDIFKNLMLLTFAPNRSSGERYHNVTTTGV